METFGAACEYMPGHEQEAKERLILYLRETVDQLIEDDRFWIRKGVGCCDPDDPLNMYPTIGFKFYVDMPEE